MTAALHNDHRIAERIETVFCIDRLPVCAHHELVSRERRDEHEQGRARKMKIGDKFVYGANARRVSDEDARLPRSAPESAVVEQGALERPHRGRADAPDGATGLP